jgi:hypothetical protein
MRNFAQIVAAGMQLEAVARPLGVTPAELRGCGLTGLWRRESAIQLPRQ